MPDLRYCFLPQYKVKDIAEADFGRLEIELAEAEMPGECGSSNKYVVNYFCARQ
jgi:S-adenosylhomocysteine hydrolase